MEEWQDIFLESFRGLPKYVYSSWEKVRPLSWLLLVDCWQAFIDWVYLTSAWMPWCATHCSLRTSPNIPSTPYYFIVRFLSEGVLRTCHCPVFLHDILQPYLQTTCESQQGILAQSEASQRRIVTLRSLHCPFLALEWMAYPKAMVLCFSGSLKIIFWTFFITCSLLLYFINEAFIVRQ